MLDRAALVAGWREGLLAQAVLAGRTKGYRHHPQLARFQTTADPLSAIATFLHALADEAGERGYRFDRTRVDLPASDVRIPVTSGQLEFETAHLRAKVRQRQPEWEANLAVMRPHPLFDVVPGDVEQWERP